MERCKHDNAKSQYRVVCEDCGVVILPDIVDRFDTMMRDQDIFWYRINKIDSNVEFLKGLVEDLIKLQEEKNGEKI